MIMYEFQKIHSNLFRKSYKGNWIDEMFKIAEIKNEHGQVTYGVEDLNGKEIMGLFMNRNFRKFLINYQPN
jgi:hypothetical protein